MIWFNSIPADLSFCKTAKYSISLKINSTAKAERLYEVLLTGENQTIWAKGFKKLVWFNPSPYDFGSIRDIHLAWIKVRERMLILEPNKHFAFSSDALTVPIVTKMVEDIQFQPTATGTIIHWNVYYNLYWFLIPFKGFLKKRIFQKMFFDFAKGLSDYAEKYPSKIS